MEELNLGETLSKIDPLEVDEELRKLSSEEATTYSSLYLAFLEKSYYNILLSDYSFLQFGWTAQDRVRYAYYPNPFSSGEDRQGRIRAYRELVDADIMPVEDFLLVLRGTEEPDIRAPLIRYENAPDQYKVLAHPCSHFHIGHHSENRWAVSRVVTPLAFTFLIMKHYYSFRWRVFDDEASEFGNQLEERLVTEKMNCRVLGDDQFHEFERRSFHFA
jgi:hypothetical protein